MPTAYAPTCTRPAGSPPRARPGAGRSAGRAAREADRARKQRATLGRRAEHPPGAAALITGCRPGRRPWPVRHRGPPGRDGSRAEKGAQPAGHGSRATTSSCSGGGGRRPARPDRRGRRRRPGRGGTPTPAQLAAQHDAIDLSLEQAKADRLPPRRRGRAANRDRESSVQGRHRHWDRSSGDAAVSDGRPRMHVRALAPDGRERSPVQPVGVPARPGRRSGHRTRARPRSCSRTRWTTSRSAATRCWAGAAPRQPAP